MNNDADITSIVVESMLDGALRATKRREFLCRNAPKRGCPNCGTNQIQLLGRIIAQWKCRHCKTKFRFEPLKLLLTK